MFSILEDPSWLSPAASSLPLYLISISFENVTLIKKNKNIK